MTTRCAPGRCQVHDVKTWPQSWADIDAGTKTVDLRRDDRGYGVGDLLMLREWDPTQVTRDPHSQVESPGWFTGRVCQRLITHVEHGGEYGLAEGYVALSLSEPPSVLSGPSTPEERYQRLDGPIHTHFGLSYANYLALPRTLMQSMPVQWQTRIVACLEDLHRAFAHVEQAPGYNVQACQWAAPEELDEEQLQAAGVTFSLVDGEQAEYSYFDRDGNELRASAECIPLPVEDPVPHYNRGRSYIEPRTHHHESGV